MTTPQRKQQRITDSAWTVAAALAALGVGALLFNHLPLTRILGTAAVLVGTVAAWTFVILYRRDEWRTWPEGRHLMHFTAGMAVILTYASMVAVAASFGWVIDPRVAYLIRLLAFAWLAGQLVWRVRLLLRAYRD